MTSALLLALLSAPDGGVLLARPVWLKADDFELQNKLQRAEYWGHARAVRDSTTITCEHLVVRYDASGEVERILASGDVVAVDGERQAWGDEADYDNRTGVLVVHGHPRGRQGVREVTGETVTFTTGTDTLFVTKAHTISPSERVGSGATVVIDADALTLVQTQATATWKGHVRATRGLTVMTSPELDATWDANGVITRMVAKGGVEAVEPTRRAKGQRADFDAVKGLLVVTGRPEAHQGKNHMKGTRVTFFPDPELVHVENAETIIEQEPKRK